VFGKYSHLLWGENPGVKALSGKKSHHQIPETYDGEWLQVRLFMGYFQRAEWKTQSSKGAQISNVYQKKKSQELEKVKHPRLQNSASGSSSSGGTLGEDKQVVVKGKFRWFNWGRGESWGSQ